MIGIDPQTRLTLDHKVSLALEYDVSYMRLWRGSLDAFHLTGSNRQHPLSLPIDAQRQADFENACAMEHASSPLALCTWKSPVALDRCARRAYVCIKRYTLKNVGSRVEAPSCNLL